MAQPQESTSFDQVLRLVDQLPPKDQEKLRRTLDARTWIREWEDLADNIEKRRQSKALPSLTDKEIAAEFKDYRNEEKAKRGQSNR